MELSGKVVLVAGGAGGIGLGIAKAFANEGCKVAITDNRLRNVANHLSRAC